MCSAAAAGAGSDTEALLEFGRGIRQDPSLREATGTPWNPTSELDADGCPVDWHGVQCSGGQILSIALDGIGLVGNASLSALARMPMLRNLSLSNNKLEGFLPRELGSMASLQLLDLSNNRFSGPIPSELTKLAGLGYLNLSSNGFHGALPLGLGNLRKLKYLDLRANGFIGKLDDIFVQLQSPVHVDLSCNQFSGSLTSISDNSSMASTLQYLNISHNVLSGTLFGSDPMPLLDSLEVFDASFNMLSGNIPQFNFVISLKVLRLQNNNFSGSIPEALFRETSMVLTELDLSCNQLTGNSFAGNLPLLNSNAKNSTSIDLSILPVQTSNLSFVDLSNNSLSGSLPTGIGDLSALTLLDLRQNNFTGQIPKAITKLKNLVYIDLSSNHFTGSIPDGLPDDLVEFNVSYNSLSGSVPSNLLKFPDSSFHPGNELLVLPRSASANGSDKSDKGRHGMKRGILYALIVCVVVFVTGIIVLLLVHWKINSWKRSEKGTGQVVFTAEELSRAPAEIIGRSCHGTSYKATLDNGYMLTVKWLKEGFAKSKKEFSREIKKLGSVKHPNLVPLGGYYWGPKEHERIIISDYVDATSLSTYLSEFEERNLPPLSVGQRLNIATDIARCLDYLHNERVIPHGNIKSSNVLIQSSASALVTDYSLHRLMTPTGMAEQVLNAGALGYSPPEFSSTSKPCPSLKSDVYAFGVILLELLTGKIAGEIICMNDGVVDLTDWVRMLALEERVSECYDRHIAEVGSSDGAPKALDDMLHIAIRCIRSASERPEIRTVFEDLSSLSS
nr:unnamed protein product [Digitaria exilis]